MEEKAGRVERDFRAAERRSRTLSVRQTERSSTPVARPVTPVAPSSGSAQPHEGAVPAITPQTRPQTPTHIRPQALQVVIPNAIRSPPLPYNTLPTPVSHPRVRTARRDQGSPTRNRSGSSTENAGHDPFVIPMPRATLPLDLPPLPHHSGPSQSQENRDQSSRLERDIVSGQWKVVVTSRTMKPPRSLSRVDASKWSRGEISIHLSQSRESLEAEFALFGLDGIIKSERFEISREGVRVTVEFVAQIPGATEYEEIKTLGPSRNRRGHLIFEAGKVRGMLSCPRYGKLEFEGVRIGVPRPMCASWSDWL
ncbi:hypothetical protein FS749_011162 [Ceratobasidium sp. UAMH 11750]|nr:hypothetical protein FS749_011162 [Ceratobasidium sp. UAMH 11750]